MEAAQALYHTFQDTYWKVRSNDEIEQTLRTLAEDIASNLQQSSPQFDKANFLEVCLNYFRSRPQRRDAAMIYEHQTVIYSYPEYREL
jgi:hypothetical protein